MMDTTEDERLAEADATLAELEARFLELGQSARTRVARELAADAAFQIKRARCLVLLRPVRAAAVGEAIGVAIGLHAAACRYHRGADFDPRPDARRTLWLIDGTKAGDAMESSCKGGTL